MANRVQGKRAAVIGAGFGGLAAAIRLQSEGFAVTLIEARDKPGGRAYVYERDGFTFDAGPTVITAPHCLEELFTLSGRRLEDYVELLPVDPFYRLLWSDGDQFDYTGDGRMRDQISARFPDDLEGYDRFIKYTADVFKEGYEKLAATPFLNFTDMIRVAPQLVRLRADRSVYSTVSRHIRNPKLREALSFHSLLVGGNPFETSSIYTLIHHLERKWGVYFPRGGTGALVNGLVRLFEDLGGELRLSSPVEKIQVHRNGTVQHEVIASDLHASFDLVVSNADLHHTYERLYRENRDAQSMTRRLERMNWSMSLFVLYFGTNREYRDQVAHHTIVFGPRYKELLNDIFHGHELAEDFSLYLHCPTVTDPSLAPAGQDAFYVLSPVPHLGQAPLDWSERAETYADSILESLETVLPDLRQHIATKFWMTPKDFATTLRSYQGSAFSCAPKLTQSAWFRPHNRDPRIPGLYLVGAGTHPGAGVPGVVNSAKATVDVVLRDFGS